MKISLFAVMLIGIIILFGCSGDRVVVDRITPEKEISYSSGLCGVSDTAIPQDNGEKDVRTISYIGICFNAYGASSGVYNKISVAVSVYYELYQPVPPGIEMHLEVIPDSLATINDTVYTAIWGWAFAKLVYPAIYASEEVQVVASCGSIADTVMINLPICPGALELSADPQRLYVEQPGAYDTATIACQLTNRAGIPQRNGNIIFIAFIAGEICGPTSAYTDDRGFCYTQYRIRYEDIPDGNNDPNSIYTLVRAILFGYPDMEEEISLFCTRP